VNAVRHTPITVRPNSLATSMRTSIVTLSVLLATGAAQLRAQPATVSELPAGERVRLQLELARGTPVIGTILQASSDSLRVRRDKANDTLLLTWTDIDRLELSVLRFSAAEGARRGARTGFLVGAVVSAVALAAAVNSDRHGGDYIVPATGMVAVLGVGFTLGTTVLGGALGAAAPGDRWIELYRRNR
jgi:hypothetical protein